ncbi:hypothetical protein BH10BAC2_BH10BAC2_33430 [soil metagenome]
MELNQMKSIWQSYDNKLEKSLKLNMRCLEMIQGQKVKSILAPLLWLRVFEILLHVIVVYWLAGFLYKHFSEIYVAVSAAALLAFFTIALVNAVKQIVIIKQMDYSDDIVTIQSSLIMLQTHIVDYIRLTFLGMPMYLAYPIIAFKALANFDIVSKLHGGWWIGQVIFSIVLMPVCVWLYRQVSYKNIHKKWVKFIIEKSSGNSVAKAMQFIKELEALKKESI